MKTQKRLFVGSVPSLQGFSGPTARPKTSLGRCPSRLYHNILRIIDNAEAAWDGDERDSVLDCGSPLPLLPPDAFSRFFRTSLVRFSSPTPCESHPVRKRQGTAALQDAVAPTGFLPTSILSPNCSSNASTLRHGLKSLFIFVACCGVMHSGFAHAQSPFTVLPAMASAPQGRERLLMDSHWRFVLGNANDPAADFDFGTSTDPGWAWLNKQDTEKGVTANSFNDSAWREVNLPHDWGVELPFTKTTKRNLWANLPLGREFPEASIGWYRKSFDVSSTDKGRRIFVEFEGVSHDCIVLLNGIFLGTHFSAYTSFGFDVTDMVHYGGRNVLVVRADARANEGWWYQGAGIYRHVWLIKTGPVHVPQWGTQVISAVNGNAAKVTVKTQVVNDSDLPSCVIVQSSIVEGADGTVVAQTSTRADRIHPWEQKEVQPVIDVANPKLWSIESPHLYRLVTTLRVGDAEVDRYETPFGIRSIVFDPDRGFLLNGNPVKIKGFCDHLQHAGVGVAVPDALWYWRLKKMKNEMGANAIRIGSKAPTPAFLDACDRIGMLVMDESRLFSSGPEGLDQIRSLVRRDRNHPSVILWCSGNEEFGLQSGERGRALMETIQREFHRLDPTRKVTFAASNGGVTTGINQVVDVRGINYLNLFDEKLGQPRDKNVPRDRTPEEYHKNHPQQPIIGSEETAETEAKNEGWWKYIDEHPWYGGVFIWTGFAYYGESERWPEVISPFGAVDLCGFPRESYWFYRKAWTGKERTREVSGTIPAAIDLASDRPTINADAEDVAVVNIGVVDSGKALVSTASHPLVFSISGPGRIIGLGNGNESSHDPGKGNRITAYRGHAQVLVQSTREAGIIHLEVNAKGLPSASLSISAKACNPRPSVP